MQKTKTFSRLVLSIFSIFALFFSSSMFAACGEKDETVLLYITQTFEQPDGTFGYDESISNPLATIEEDFENQPKSLTKNIDIERERVDRYYNYGEKRQYNIKHVTEIKVTMNGAFKESDAIRLEVNEDLLKHAGYYLEDFTYKNIYITRLDYKKGDPIDIELNYKLGEKYEYPGAHAPTLIIKKGRIQENTGTNLITLNENFDKNAFSYWKANGEIVSTEPTFSFPSERPEASIVYEPVFNNTGIIMFVTTNENYQNFISNDLDTMIDSLQADINTGYSGTIQETNSLMTLWDSRFKHTVEENIEHTSWNRSINFTTSESHFYIVIIKGFVVNNTTQYVISFKQSYGDNIRDTSYTTPVYKLNYDNSSKKNYSISFTINVNLT